MTARRQFIQWIPIACAALAASRGAQAAEKVDEKSPTATQLAYVHDASKVDKAKQPKYVAGSHCGTCQLYQGKAGDEWGACPLFQGKQVAAAGWCNAYIKKA